MLKEKLLIHCANNKPQIFKDIRVYNKKQVNIISLSILNFILAKVTIT